MTQFGMHPSTAAIVPATVVARDDRLHVQVARFVPGVRLDRLLPAMTVEQREGFVERSLVAARAIADAAEDFVEILPRLGCAVSIVDESAASLTALSQLGVSSSDTETLRWALEVAGEVRATAQHRDLWPRNIVRGPCGECRIVDFDEYGDVVVPLYDAFHLVRSVDDALRLGARRPWIDRLEGNDESASLMRAALRREVAHAGLTPRQAMGCLIFYLLDFPASIFRRKTTEAFWGTYRDELPVIARRLRNVGSLEALHANLLKR